MSGSTTSALDDRNARLFLGVTLTSGFGNTAMSLAASVWVLALTGSASLAALCGLCIYAPSLLGPLLGALVDRRPRQRLLVATSAAMAALLLALLAVRGPGQIWMIFAVMLGYGVSYVLLDAGEAAVLQSAVPADVLGGVNSLRMSVQEGMKLVAPLVGAALFTWKGGGSVAALASVALGVAACCYAAIRPGTLPGPATDGRSLLGDTRDGMDFLRRHAPLRRLVIAGSAAVAMSGLANAAAYLVIIGDLHRAPEFAGVLAAAQGAGSIGGGLLCGRILDRRGDTAAVWWGAVLSAVGTLLLCVPLTPVVAAGRVLVGVGLPWTVIAAMTAVQRHTPASLIGRVAATANTAVFAPTALTIALGAVAVTKLDHRAVLAAAATGTVLAALPLAAVVRRPAAEPIAVTPVTEPLTDRLSVRIRPAVEDDAAALAGLIAEMSYHIDPDTIRQRLRELPHDHPVLVAESHTDVIGWVQLRPGHALVSGVRAELVGLAVTERMRGSGVGTALVAAAEDWTRRHGMDTLFLRSGAERTAAHDFYRGRGFHQIKSQFTFGKEVV